MNKKTMVMACLCSMAVAGSASAMEPVLRLQVGVPLVMTGSAGLKAEGDGLQPAASLEAGIGGWKASVGADSLGEGLGWGIKASLLHTWLKPINMEEDLTYIGLDLEVGYEMIFASVGGYVQAGGEDDDNFITTLSLGVRF